MRDEERGEQPEVDGIVDPGTGDAVDPDEVVDDRDILDVPEWVSEFRRLYVEPKTRAAVREEEARRRRVGPAAPPGVRDPVPGDDTAEVWEAPEQPMADEPLRSRTEVHRDRRTVKGGRGSRRAAAEVNHEPPPTVEAETPAVGSRADMRRAREERARRDRRMRLRRTVVVGVLLLVVAAVVTWLVARNREPVSASPAALVEPVVAPAVAPSAVGSDGSDASAGAGGSAGVGGAAATGSAGGEAVLVSRREAPAPTPTASAGTRQVGTPRAAATPTPRPAPSPVARGTGRMSWVDWGEVDDVRTSGGRVVRVALEIEGGLRVDAAETAEAIAEILVDDRGWQTERNVRFVFVTPKQAERGRFDTRIGLASKLTTMDLCGPVQTEGFTSCYNGRVVINLDRWMLGVDAYEEHLDEYRVYVVNHEVGHSLGLGHAECPGTREPAPVMVPQTLHLWGCQPNPYPVID